MVVVKVDSFTLLLTILQICPETENNEKHFGIVAILLDATPSRLQQGATTNTEFLLTFNYSNNCLREN